MTYSHTWTPAANDVPPGAAPTAGTGYEGLRFQDLCVDLFKLGDMLACYIFDSKGNVAGREFGSMEVDEELKTRFAEIAAVIWGGLARVEVIGGQLKSVTADYVNFRIVGIPNLKLRIGVILVLGHDVNAATMKERATDYLNYYMDAKKGQARSMGSRLVQGLK